MRALHSEGSDPRFFVLGIFGSSADPMGEQASGQPFVLPFGWPFALGGQLVVLEYRD